MSRETRSDRSWPHGIALVGVGLFLLGTGCLEGDLQVREPLPVADLGFDQVRFLGDATFVTIELDARGSCDPLGALVERADFEILEAPDGALVEINRPEPLRGSFEVSAVGVYLVSLRVSAGGRRSIPDVATIDVRAGDGDDVVLDLPGTNGCGESLL